MSDDGFHEIQLNGKQLVFLFMATTVVSVVIFLCGVLVGRGVRAEQDAVLTAEQSEFVSPEAEAAGTGDDLTPASEAPANVQDEPVSYPDRLDAAESTVEEMEELVASAPPPVVEPAEATAPPAEPVAEPDPAPSAAGQFSVQVAALRERPEADVLVERLAGKGYDAYVLAPTPGSPTAVYRVRVGHYQDRTEAEAILRRLEQEEQFKPWITR